MYQRPYAVPRNNLETFKKELQHLVRIGVLEAVGATAWSSPTFIIAKKDKRVRWVSDFRELNKVIKRKIYPLPRIQDILQKRPGYEFFTKLDISMMYYTLELDDESKDLCTIGTPFGHFRYTRAVMGCKCSSDWAQETLEGILSDVEEADVYVDDIGCFDSSWEAHLRTLDRVLTRLQDNGFSINPLKCEWAVKETDWLGYWLTPAGLKPWRKKVDAVLNLDRPRSMKDVRSFIGAVTYYRDMYPRRSHVLAPLTELTSKKSFEWQSDHQSAFDQMKALLTSDTFMRYPDHNEAFHVYTDASDKQLGAVIMQNGKPVAFYSRKLNAAQCNYTTMEKELLSVVETLKEFRTMLYGCKELHVHTDHHNLTYNTLNSQRVMRWRLFLEDYSPTWHYIKGDNNKIADAFSRLPILERQSPSVVQARSPAEHRSLSSELEDSSESTDSEDCFAHAFSVATDDDLLLDCLLNHPDVDEGNPFVLDYESIAAQQQNDQRLQQLLVDDPVHYSNKLMSPGVSVICYTEANKPWKICLPDTMLDETIHWYHLSLNHVGMNKTFDSMSMHLHHPDLKDRCIALIGSCDPCQRYKLPGKGYGELPPRDAEIAPWREVAVDLIGPWRINVNGQEVVFRALTIIDTVTNYCEIIRINNKTAAHVGLQFENAWLSRYPRPLKCIFDQGKEFTGEGFQRVLH